MSLATNEMLPLDEFSDADCAEENEFTGVWTLSGFLGKTKVMTSFGNLPIEALRLHDPVKTRSGHFRKVAWIDQLSLDRDFTFDVPDALPVQIGRGTLGPNFPLTDVCMSPAQTILPTRHGGNPVLARDLAGRPRIIRPSLPTFTYYLFHCGQPEDVLVDGMWCQTAP